MTKISAIITTFKRPDFLNRAIKSVINQTVNVSEIIVINDNIPGSEEDLTTTEVIKSLSNHSIRQIHTKGAEGPSVGRNMGIKAATSEYICFLDDDDCWLSEKLEFQLNFLERKKIEIAIGACEYRYGSSTKTSFTLKNEEFRMKDLYIGGRSGGILSSLIIKSNIAQGLLFEEEVWFGEDQVYLACLLRSNYKIGFINKPLLIKDNLSSDSQLSMVNNNPENYLNMKRFCVNDEVKKALGFYYWIIYSRFLLGSNISLRQLSFRRLITSILKAGFTATCIVLLMKLYNFAIRKFSKSHC